MTRMNVLVCVTMFVSISSGKVLLNFDSLRPSSTKFVSVVFRHGDRTPDVGGEEYPNDPYANETFFPIGRGGLTNAGKSRLYQLGGLLRGRYGHFLGDYYVSNNVYAQSTDYDRTKMSLQLVLAHLFAPKRRQRWNDFLDWQPIPTTYFSIHNDKLMIPEKGERYLDERNEVEREPEVVEKLKSFESFMKNLTIWTGKNIHSTTDMYDLYHALMAVYSMNLKLPKWAKGIFPDGRLLDGINLEYEIFSYNDRMRKSNGGVLLKRIIDDMLSVQSGNSTRKINLFGGHETNVAAVLQALGVYKPHVPAYSSAVVIELIQTGQQYFVKILHYLGIPSKFEIVKIPGCSLPCPLSSFISIINSPMTETKEDVNLQLLE